MDMTVEVPPIATTQLTGLIGSVSVVKRNRRYAVRLENGKPPQCELDGKRVTPTHNVTMLKLVKSARQFFNV